MTHPGFWKTRERLLRGLYPPTCVLCGAQGEGELDLCAPCLADLPRNRDCCRRCALPLPAERPSGALCGECQRRLPPYAVCHAAFRYEGPLPILVGGAKFRARLNLARLLGQCLANALGECGAELPELIVPVPLHAKRLRERGYNQALELARTLGRVFSIPVDVHSCVRVSATPPQAGLARKERQPNVRGAFRILHPPGVERVAILDDVVTTGSTVSELTRVLLKAGVKRVDVWAVARTP
ncbi:ComF family protein [Candidatus Thiosymbion oneisti]|uniref:ComF family protein n=1 Tax=Candidatus Thiosymbion oneisti TaxID=589554 RepID=UPI001A9C4F28|nr:ComF family protein [Candidatus Thiosymbion oneisti]